MAAVGYVCIITLREKLTSPSPYLSSPTSLHGLDVTTSGAPERVFHSARAFHTSSESHSCSLEICTKHTEQHMAK